MSKIRPLPAKFVNMIAAGEVVERPASVIKELIENSIDAGATSVSVSLRDAGCAELIVEDNGRGIPRSEVPIAFVRHATSKFTAEDLLSFSFLGFRGEALASIAAVARVEMETCHAGVATTATIDGSQKITLRPGRITQGTRIAVRELFYATPVRLNFLKTKKTENGYNRDVFNHLALTNPNVAFRYYEEDMLVKDAPLPLSDAIPIAQYKDSGEGLDVSIGESVGEDLVSHGMKLDALRQRCEAILGRGFVGHALDCVAARDGYHVEGLISTPTWNRVRSDHIFISVNGRIVRDRALANAVKFAYRDTLAREKFPVAVLHLHVPSLEVDVNVSPSKTEMRFRQLPVIRSLIKMAVESAIAAAGVGNNAMESTEVASRLGAPEVLPAHGFASPGDAQDNTFAGLRSPDALPRLHASEQGYTPTFPGASPAPAPAVDPLEATRAQFAHSHVTDETAEAGLTVAQLGTAKAQLARTYIVSESAEGLVLIDQHAAHERIVYERIKARLVLDGITAQEQLIPESVVVDAADMETILPHLVELSRIGIVIEPYNEDSLVVRSIPVLLGKIDIQGFVHALIDAAKDNRLSAQIEDSLWEVCSSIACHGSIRAGRELSLEEMNLLISAMAETPRAGQCNHGRPTWIRLGWGDVERLFGRK